MEIQVEKQEKNYGLLKVNVVQDDFMPEYNREVKEYSKKANLKGFRPGKVPAGLIKKMMGKEFKLEVFNKKVTQEVQKYISENEIKTILPPTFRGDLLTTARIDNDKEHNLEFEFCYMPELSFAIEDLELQDYELEVSDEKLEEVIENIKKNSPATEEVETAEKGDFIKVNVSWVEKDAEGNETPASKEDTSLPTNQLKESAQGLFEGKKSGDKVSSTPEELFEDPAALRFMIDKEKEDMEGFNPTLNFEITKVERSKPAELNQELFDKVLGEGKVANEEDFRKELKEEVKKTNQQAISAVVSQELYDKVIELFPNEYPEELVTKFMQGEDTTKEITEEQVEKFKRDLNWQSATRQIFDKGELSVSQGDVREQAKKDLKTQFESMGMPMLDDQFLENFLGQYLEMENGKNADDAYNKVYTAKLIDYVKSKAKVDVKSITLDELDVKLKEINEKYQKEQGTEPQPEEPSAEVIEDSEEEAK